MSKSQNTRQSVRDNAVYWKTKGKLNDDLIYLQLSVYIYICTSYMGCRKYHWRSKSDPGTVCQRSACTPQQADAPPVYPVSRTQSELGVKQDQTSQFDPCFRNAT